MKKLVKGFCIAAVVLIVSGILLCIGGAAAGGAALATGILHDFGGRHGYGHGVPFIKEERVELVPGEGIETYSDTEIPVDGVTKLKVQTVGGQIDIVEKEKDSDTFSIGMNGNAGDVRVKAGTLIIEIVKFRDEEKSRLEIPEGYCFDEAEISSGAGSVRVDAIHADDLDIEIGAGNVEVQRLAAKKADFEVGAGEMHIYDGHIRECDAEVGMGKFEYNGMIVPEFDSEKCKVEVAMGSALFRVNGNKEDYNYRVECEAGEVIIGDETYSGLHHETHMDHHAQTGFDIECGMGNVTLEFEGGNTDEEIDEVL